MALAELDQEKQPIDLSHELRPVHEAQDFPSLARVLRDIVENSPVAWLNKNLGWGIEILDYNDPEIAREINTLHDLAYSNAGIHHSSEPLTAVHYRDASEHGDIVYLGIRDNTNTTQGEHGRLVACFSLFQLGRDLDHSAKFTPPDPGEAVGATPIDELQDAFFHELGKKPMDRPIFVISTLIRHPRYKIKLPAEGSPHWALLSAVAFELMRDESYPDGFWMLTQAQPGTMNLINRGSFSRLLPAMEKVGDIKLGNESSDPHAILLSFPGINRAVGFAYILGIAAKQFVEMTVAQEKLRQRRVSSIQKKSKVT